ncbi:HTH-type transcriptional repressor CsiR [compost metagenome]
MTDKVSVPRRRAAFYHAGIVTPAAALSDRRASAKFVIRRLSTMLIFSLTKGWDLASFSGNENEGVDNMLEAAQAAGTVQEDSETLSENVFRRIQAAIVKGEIAPGSKISEPELARVYGISRGPLREAIHRLEGQRLLVRVPHVGARVVSLNHAELIELYEIRESLEGMACRLAAERMSTTEIDELRRVLETHERDEAFKAGLGYYQQEGDFDFHYRIIQGSGNRTLTQMLCGELYQLVRMYRIQFSATPNRPHQAFAEHHRILDAIADRDGELAELLMRRHIGASKRNIERHYQDASQTTR